MGACDKILNIIACALFGASLLFVLITFDPKKAGGFIAIDFVMKQKNPAGNECAGKGCGGASFGYAGEQPAGSKVWLSGKKYLYHPLYISKLETQVATCTSTVDGICTSKTSLTTKETCEADNRTWDLKCDNFMAAVAGSKLLCENKLAKDNTTKCTYAATWQKCSKIVEDEKNGLKRETKNCVHMLTDYLDRKEDYFGWYHDYAAKGNPAAGGEDLRKSYMSQVTTAAAICFCTAIVCHLLAFALGGFIFNWKVGFLNSLNLATVALVLYIVAIAAFAGNFTMPGKYRAHPRDTGMGTCKDVEGLTDAGCDAGLLLGKKVKPYTSKTTCEAATATGVAPGKGKACVYMQAANTEGMWNEDKGTKKISSGGALIIVAILFMAAAIVLAGYQLRKDQDEEDKAAAAPAVEPNLVAIRQE